VVVVVVVVVVLVVVVVVVIMCYSLHFIAGFIHHVLL
jgi:hypothetical protein